MNIAQSYLLQKGRVLNEKSMPFRAARNNSQTENSYYYIFNAEADRGYVIVSGDSRTPEILGYVDQGTFDYENIPIQMKEMLQMYADEIKFLDQNNIQEGHPALKAKRMSKPVRRFIPEILTTRWNQGHPYNLTCPKYYKGDGTQDYPATGCTATAMAQVMKFYNYPEKTKAAIPGISNTYTLDNGTKQTVTTKAIPRSTVIDWEGMKDTYDCNDSHVHDRADTAVANLMYYCGQAVNMGYGPSSGANFSASAYINYFGFDDSAHVIERGDCSIDEWFDLFYNEVSQGYPVLISGFSSGGGHAFVVDGFDGDQLFHLNWGWGGGSNGWFLIGILNPGDNSGIGASSSSDGYSMSQRALFDLRLPDNVRVEKDTRLTIHDIKISGQNISANFINWTGSTNSFHCGIVALQDDGSVKLVGTSQTITDLGANYYQNKTFSVKSRLQPGTYRLSPASKLSSAKIWRPELDLKRHYILAEVDSARNAVLTMVDPLEDITIDTIVFPGKRIVGQEQEVKVTFRNNGDEYYHEVKMFASTNDTRVYTESRSNVAVRKGETVDVSYFFKPTEVGTYTLWFSRNSDGYNEIGSGTMEVVSEANAQKDNLSVTSFTITNSLSGVVYGNQLTGTCNIKNNGTNVFNGRVKLQLWRQPNGSGSAWSSSSRTVQMEIEPGKTGKAPFEFTGLDNTSKYYIQAAYTSQSGDLTNGGIWAHGWNITAGALYWKNNGALVAAKGTSMQSVNSAACGMYVKGYRVASFRTTSNTNPNCIIAVDDDPNIKTKGLEDRNFIVGDHAGRIELTNGYPYYNPVAFTADTARLHHIFPEGTDGTRWETFTLPFNADSICIDETRIAYNDSTAHVWIYEFSSLTDDNEVVFTPATFLRGNTPYIMIADKSLAGAKITFFGNEAPFFNSAESSMFLSSEAFNMYGTCYNTTVVGGYFLNESGTAFEYSDASTVVPGTQVYFTTKLGAEVRPSAIPLPVVEFPEYDPDYVDGIGCLKATDANASSQTGYDLSGRMTRNVGKGQIILTPGRKELK